MKHKRMLQGALAAAVVFSGFWGCKTPKYVSYVSIHGDFRCSVPWGWSVITDDDLPAYSATTFLGPFDSRFFLGLPSLSARWYSYGRLHRLRDGSSEVYFRTDDYIAETLKKVYGPDQVLVEPVSSISLSGGRVARHFVVLSAAPVPKTAKWGVSRSESGQAANLRRHAYVVIPRDKGFYVLIYPATRDGYEAYEPSFNELVNTFQAL